MHITAVEALVLFAEVVQMANSSKGISNRDSDVRNRQKSGDTTLPRPRFHTCGIVLVSRRAGRPLAGSIVFTHSSMTDSGDSGVPLGLKLSVSGSSSGSWSSGTATGSCHRYADQCQHWPRVAAGAAGACNAQFQLCNCTGSEASRTVS